MPAIAKSRPIVTLRNVFTVDPQNRHAGGSDGDDDEAPAGFISAGMRKSLDGGRVANDAQWERREALEAIWRNPEATAHMNDIVKAAKPEGGLYEVVFTEEASTPGGQARVGGTLWPCHSRPDSAPPRSSAVAVA